MEELTSGDPDDWLASPTVPPAPARAGPVATLDLGDNPAGPGSAAGGGRPADGPATADPEAPFGRLGGLTGGPSADAALRPPRVRFATFVVTASDRLLGPAYLLTGDRDRAEHLLRAALAGAAVSWSRSRRDPVADVLRVLVREYLGPFWWWPRPTPAAALPGDVGAGLARLDAARRAAVVLRYHARLTEEQTATALGAPAGNVRSWLSHALDALGIDPRLDLRPQAGPRLSRAGLSAELDALAAAPASADRGPLTPAVLEEAVRLEARLAEVRQQLPSRRRRERRRRATAWFAVAAGAVGVLAGALALAGPVPDPVLDARGRSGVDAGLPGDSAIAARSTAAAELFDPRNRPPDPNRFVFRPDLVGDPLLVAAVGERGQQQLVLRFTPHTTHLAFSSFCQSSADVPGRLEVSVNGHELTVGQCQADSRANSETEYPADAPMIDGPGVAFLGVRPGHRSELRLRLTSDGGTPLPDAREPVNPVRIGIAVYELTGPRVRSDGMTFKRQVENAGIRYSLVGYRTTKVTAGRRVPASKQPPARTSTLSLTVPAGRTSALILVGLPGTRSTNPAPIPMTIDGTEVSIGSYGGTISFTLPGPGRHVVTLRARPDDTGAMVLAWYRAVDDPVK
jgi:hypothetical protein